MLGPATHDHDRGKEFPLGLPAGVDKRARGDDQHEPTPRERERQDAVREERMPSDESRHGEPRI